MTNKMQLFRIILLFPCFLAALHVLSDVIVHYQGYLNCSSFGGLEVACWTLVPKFAGSHPAEEAVGFLG